MKRYVIVIISMVIIIFLLSPAMHVSFNAKSDSASSGYIYPLKRVYYISSTFGEFRENHFHAGIDFTTRMRIGEPVYAVNDGEIFRIKYQYRGYGKVLYIRHKNDIISVYAHLDRFENNKLKLEDILKINQEKENKKYVDVYLDEHTIRVKRGQLVAYSGETGEGLPHLHLELRKGEENPINPFNEFYREKQDKTQPRIQGFVLCPATADSYIDSKKWCQSIPLKKKQGVYQADWIPVIQGEFTISVSIFDRAESIYWRSPKNIWFYINNKLAFEVASTIFSFTENRYFGFLHDQSMHGYEHFNIPVQLCDPLSRRLSM